MKIELYIPTTKKVVEVLKQNEIDNLINFVVQKFNRNFDGCTLTTAKGFYNSPIHGLIKEDINIVHTFANNDVLSKRVAFNTAIELCKKAEQECILIVFDNVHYFIAKDTQFEDIK